MKFETKVIHAGQAPDPRTGAVMTPIYATSTYAQSSPGEHKGFDYARTHNPTRDALERCVAELEGGDARLRLRLGHGGDRHACSSCSTPARTSWRWTTCTAAATGSSSACASAPPGCKLPFVDLSRRQNLEAAITAEHAA